MLRASLKLAGLTIMMAGLLFNVSMPKAFAQATGDGCGVAQSLTDAQRTEVRNKARDMSTTPEAYACRNVANIGQSDRSNACVRGLCPSYGNSVLCCPGSLGAAPGTATGGASTDGPGTTGQEGGIGRLALPSCVSNGDCGVDDLVTMAVNVANFLFGISGAIFLLVFVVAGFRLIFFAPDAGTVKEAKSSLVKATTGMIIIALAGIATTYVYDYLRGSSQSGTEARGETCIEEVPGSDTTPAYSCQSVPGIPSKSDYDAYTAALERIGCRPSGRGTSNLCTGRTSYCCAPGAAERKAQLDAGATP